MLSMSLALSLPALDCHYDDIVARYSATLMRSIEHRVDHPVNAEWSGVAQQLGELRDCTPDKRHALSHPVGHHKQRVVSRERRTRALDLDPRLDTERGHAAAFKSVDSASSPFRYSNGGS